QLVELRVPGRDPVPGRGRQHLDLSASPEGAAMSEEPNMTDSTAGTGDTAGRAPAVQPATASASPAAGISDGTQALEVRSVSKYFGSVNALEDISLAVYAGQVTCVL